MFRLILTFLFISLGASASETPNDFKSTIQALHAQLPPKIQRETSPVFNRLKIIIRDSSQCLEYQVKANKPPKATVTKTEHLLYVNHACAQAPSFNRLEENLFKEFIKIWINTSGNPVSKVNVKRIVYENNFFRINETLGLNLNQSFEGMYVDFWTLSIKAYTGSPQFVSLHPDLYLLLRKYVFEDKDVFSESRVDPYIFSSKSIDLFPSMAKLKYISEANESWFIRYQMVKNAKKSIMVQYYAYHDDVFGRAFIGLLLDALKRGVRVQMMLDGRGSLLTARGETIEALMSQGAEIVTYNPMLLNLKSLTKFFKVGLIDAMIAGNHDKILLVDETQLLTGGTNIGDEYFIKQSESEHRAYNDADVYASFDKPFGDAIAAFAIEFYSKHSVPVKVYNLRKSEQIISACESALAAVEELMHNKVLSPETIKKYPELSSFHSINEFHSFDRYSLSEPTRVRGLDKTSQLMDQVMMREVIFDLISRSKHQIVIQNPYVVLTKRMEAALIEAANRGVKIIFNTTSPASTDSVLTQSILAVKWKEVLREIPNAEIYAARGPERLHAKIFVFDYEKTIIGGYNMDTLSQKHNSEFGLLVESKSFANQVIEEIFKFIQSNTLRYSIENDEGPYDIKGSEEKKLKLDLLYFFSMLIIDWV